MNVLTSKKLQLVVTLLLCAVIIVGGSFAWFSATQNVLNEFTWNPEGANLHDDFTDPNKDVFVENTGTAPLLVRVQLREFMDINNGETILPPGGTAARADKTTWPAHGGGPSGVADCGYDFHNYWQWEMGGQKWYLPATAEHIGAIQERTDNSDGGAGYAPGSPVVQTPVMEDGLPKALQPYYTDYADLEGKIGADTEMQNLLTGLKNAKQALMDAVNAYVADPAGAVTAEQVGNLRSALYTAQEAANTYSRDHFHGVQLSRAAEILTMEEWKNGSGDRDPQSLGDFWVVDSNGWCYWANTLESGEATGMLLNAVETTSKIQELKAARKRYYYGIDVTMQAATAEDVDKFTNETYTGVGQAATADAQILLGKLARASTENAAVTFAMLELPKQERGRYWYQDADGVWLFDDGRWTYDGWEWLLDGEPYPFTDHGWYSNKDSGDWWYIDDQWYFDGDEWYYFEPVPTVPPTETRGGHWYQDGNGAWLFDDGRWTYDGREWLLDGEVYPFTDHSWYAGKDSANWRYRDDQWQFDGSEWHSVDQAPTVPPVETPVVPPEETPTVPPEETPVVPPEETPTVPPVETPTTPPEETPVTPPVETPTTPPEEMPTVPPEETPTPEETPAEQPSEAPEETPPAAPSDPSPDQNG